MASLGSKLVGLISGNIGDTVTKVAQVFKVPPGQVEEHRFELDKITMEQAGKVIDATTIEIQAGAEVIKAEAQSQSWLPRNVRPLLLLLWGLAITLNVVVAILSHFWHPELLPVQIDPWVYKLTAIGFTGYTTVRTVEKLMEKDN